MREEEVRIVTSGPRTIIFLLVPADGGGARAPLPSFASAEGGQHHRRDNKKCKEKSGAEHDDETCVGTRIIRSFCGRLLLFPFLFFHGILYRYPNRAADPGI